MLFRGGKKGIGTSTERPSMSSLKVHLGRNLKELRQDTVKRVFCRGSKVMKERSYFGSFSKSDID